MPDVPARHVEVENRQFESWFAGGDRHGLFVCSRQQADRARGLETPAGGLPDEGFVVDLQASSAANRGQLDRLCRHARFELTP
jgi:hypothetical protein